MNTRPDPPFSKDWIEKYDRKLLAAVLAFAACLVAVYIGTHVRGEAFARTDETWIIARNLLDGNGYSACAKEYFPFCGPNNQQTAIRLPVPVLLMATAMLFSTSHMAGVIVQGLLFLGTALVVFALLKDYDRRAALLASLLWILSIPVKREIGSDGGHIAAAFFLSLGLYFYQKGRQNGTFPQWALAGVSLGLASLSRSVILGVSIGLCLALLWERRTRIRQGILALAGPALIVLGAFSIVMAPWVIRNELVFSKPEFGGTLVGYNLYRMNSILIGDRFIPHYVGPNEGGRAIQKLIQAGHLNGNENEAQMQSFYSRAGLQLIRSHLVGYGLLSLYRFLPLWFDLSVDAAYGMKSTLLDYIEILEQGVLLIAALIGALVFRRRFWPLILSVVLACGAYMAVDAQLRYLIDVMPAIAILAALVVLAADRRSSAGLRLSMR